MTVTVTVTVTVMTTVTDMVTGTAMVCLLGQEWQVLTSAVFGRCLPL